LGASSSYQVTIPSDNITTDATTITLKLTYISNVQELFSSAVTSLSTSRLGNGFILNNNNGSSNFSQTNNYKRENQIVKVDLSSQLYIDLNINSTEYTLLESNILSVIRLSDNVEIWNANNIGTITTNTAGLYQLVFTGYNSPISGDRVLVIYNPLDTRRFQPFSYSNYIIKSSIQTLLTDVDSDNLYVKLGNIETQSSVLSFEIIEPNTDIVLYTVTDGYLTANSDGNEGTLVTVLTDLTSVADIVHKKVKITSAENNNNNGLYDISAYNIDTNTLTITNVLDNINKDQVSIIRINDGKEIWDYDCTIVGNKLLMSENVVADVNDYVFVMIYNYSNLRKAPTRLISTISDQVVNNGVLTIIGTTFAKAEDIVFTCTSNNLKLNLNEAIRKVLSLSSTTSIPTNVELVKILKVEKVLTVSNSNNEVISVLNTYDVKNCKLYNNLFYSDEMIEDSSLQKLDFVLPDTTNNTNSSTARNLPTIGDKIRVSFYYITNNDYENLSYTRNGTLYTNKKFSLIDKIYVSSGFKSSQSTRLLVNSFTQPNIGSRYKVYYDYLAPKQNERISIKYNYNKLISDVTFGVEDTRPINADVIVREAKQLFLDVTVNIVIADDYKNSSTTVIQNLRDKLTAALTSSQLNTIVDTPTIINVAQAVKGVARARVIYFNKNGELGSVVSIQSQKDEYFSANNIIINTEIR
jgi:hypothetical protein